MARHSSLTWRTWSELLGSMRFAIGSLSILAVASVIGTLLRQREPYANYVNQFGPFWARQLRAAGVYEVYNAWWFLLVLAFLVVSTSLCLTRNTPKMLHEMRAWRERVREGSLRAFRHRGEVPLGASADAARAVPQTVGVLRALGYRVKLDAREGGTMIAAKRGSLNRLGYVFAHAGIVVICLGGLLDSELPMRAVVAWTNKTALPPNVGELREVPRSALLPPSNPSWRGNMFLPEGSASDVVLLSWRDGSLVQTLPFRVELKQFRIEFYNTGMPKLFASEVDIIDKATGARESASIKVNEPLIRDGIAIYQSSFDDGGSRLKLRAVPLDGSARSFDVAVEVGGSVPLDGLTPAAAPVARAGAAPTVQPMLAASPAGPTGEPLAAPAAALGEPAGAQPAGRGGAPAPAAPLRLEVTGFRSINVEDTSRAGAEVPQQRKFSESVAAVLSPSGDSRGKNLQNVGPSVQYKLRDAAGQAREFNVYANPMTVDGAQVFLAGVRDTPDESFRYLRIPADTNGTMAEFVRLRAALADAALRERAAERYARQASPAGGPSAEASERLRQAAHRGLDLFAAGGLQTMAEFIDRNVPRAEQERAAQALLKVLGGGLWELWQAARERDGLAPAPADEASGRFLLLAQAALSDTFLFGAPVLLELTDFTEIKASVLQLTRSPGKRVVYLGSLLLVLGVFAMFYVRERRVWCWVGRSASGAPHALYALSSTRQTIDLDREFDTLREALAKTLSRPHIQPSDSVATASGGANR